MTRTGPTPPRHVFVYGTLRQAAGHPMARLLANHARPRGRGTIAGVLLDVGPYPAALVSKAPGDVVHGEVWALHEGDASAVLAALDRYEGCAPRDDGQEALYVRAVRTVTMGDRTTLSAWVWLWNRSAKGLPRIDHGDWLRYRASG